MRFASGDPLFHYFILTVKDLQSRAFQCFAIFSIYLDDRNRGFLILHKENNTAVFIRIDTAG